MTDLGKIISLLILVAVGVSLVEMQKYGRKLNDLKIREQAFLEGQQRVYREAELKGLCFITINDEGKIIACDWRNCDKCDDEIKGLLKSMADRDLMRDKEIEELTKFISDLERKQAELMTAPE